MTEATVRSQVSLDLDMSEGEDSSNNSTTPHTRGTSGKMAEGKQKSAQKEDSASKSNPRGKSKASAKLEDLAALENKLFSQINSKFSSLDGRIGQLIGLLDHSNQSNANGSVQRRPNEVEYSTSGVCEPQERMRNGSGVRRSLVSVENTTHVDSPNLEDDQVSLQPGQRERRSLGLMSSDED